MTLFPLFLWHFLTASPRRRNCNWWWKSLTHTKWPISTLTRQWYTTSCFCLVKYLTYSVTRRACIVLLWWGFCDNYFSKIMFIQVPAIRFTSQMIWMCLPWAFMCSLLKDIEPGDFFYFFFCTYVKGIWFSLKLSLEVSWIVPCWQLVLENWLDLILQ